MQNKLSIFYVTFPDKESALNMANQLIKNKLAGCCNLICNIHSIYSWNNNIENAEEFVLIIKTIEEKKEPLIDFIQTNHPYKIPCILNLVDGTINSDYFNWLKACLV